MIVVRGQGGEHLAVDLDVGHDQSSRVTTKLTAVVRLPPMHRVDVLGWHARAAHRHMLQQME
jgi:hypothetical protein